LIFFFVLGWPGSLLLNRASAVDQGEITKITINLCVDGIEAVLQHTWVGGRMLIFFRFGMAAQPPSARKKNKVTINLCADGVEAVLQHTGVGGHRLIFFRFVMNRCQRGEKSN